VSGGFAFSCGRILTGALLAFPFSAGSAAFLVVRLHKVLLSFVGVILAIFFALAE
jgi:hypothetical protein